MGAVAATNSSQQPTAEVVRTDIVRTVRSGSSVNSTSSASSSCSENQDPTPIACGLDLDVAGDDGMAIAADCQTAEVPMDSGDDAVSEDPSVPLGPPPAKMAPPPPLGPPPDLPLDRAELKRGVEDALVNSPIGKRLRSVSITQTSTDGSQAVVGSTDGDSSSSSDMEDGHDTERNEACSDQTPRCASQLPNEDADEGDTSYAKCPASA